MEAPTVAVTLFNPTKTRRREVKAKLDTGFEGGLFLPFEVYVDLGLQLFETSRVVASLATGEFTELFASRAIVVVGGLECLCSAYTTLKASKCLLGWEVLSKLRVTLDGKRGKMSIKDP